MPTKPTVGSIVHYVSHGSADGTYKSECRAAIIADVPENEACALVVFNPAGMYFQRCLYDGSSQHRPGTWHWPEGSIVAAPVTVNMSGTLIEDADAKAYSDEVRWLTAGWPRIERRTAPVEYHWMITYLVPKLGGFYVRQKSGVCQPEGRTRGEMFEVLAQQVMDEDGLSLADFSVVYFGLEPNSLGAAS